MRSKPNLTGKKIKVFFYFMQLGTGEEREIRQTVEQQFYYMNSTSLLKFIFCIQNQSLEILSKTTVSLVIISLLIHFYNLQSNMNITKPIN